MRSLCIFAFAALVSACSKPADSPAKPAEPAVSVTGGPAVVGFEMKPITSPVAIPVKGAKLTMVNYFATWCTSSTRWVPHVEEIRKKHAAEGLAVIGVANYDLESTQADLESFVKHNGGNYPVTVDPDERINQSLHPRSWGQAIFVVDAKGVVKMAHVGTHEGDFEKVDAEITRLLAQ